MVRLVARFRLPRTRVALTESRRRGVLFCRPIIVAALAAGPEFRRLLADINEVLLRRERRGNRFEWVPIRVQHREKGQTLIEFAFVFPLLFVFILLIVDFGFALDRREVVQHAVREGARTGAVGAPISKIMDHTNEQSGNVFDSVTVCYVDGNDANSYAGNAGDSVRVSGEYTYDFMIGSGAFLSGAIPGINMKPSAEARLEKAVQGAGACP
jgi:hypothetical protein